MESGCPVHWISVKYCSAGAIGWYNSWLEMSKLHANARHYAFGSYGISFFPFCLPLVVAFVRFFGSKLRYFTFNPHLVLGTQMAGAPPFQWHHHNHHPNPPHFNHRLKCIPFIMHHIEHAPFESAATLPLMWMRVGGLVCFLT